MDEFLTTLGRQNRETAQIMLQACERAGAIMRQMSEQMLKDLSHPRLSDAVASAARPDVGEHHEP